MLTDDVCPVGIGGCEHICTNTNTSFECSCFTGYILSANNFLCDGKSNHFLSLSLSPYTLQTWTNVKLIMEVVSRHAITSLVHFFVLVTLGIF